MADILNLGKARLDLEANNADFDRNVEASQRTADSLRKSLEALVAAANAAEDTLKGVKMGSGQAAESDASASTIIEGVRGISDESRTAAENLDRVKLSQAQAVESKAAAEEISEGLNEVSRNADQAGRKLDEVRLKQSLGSKQVGGTSVGILGGAIAAGTVLAPAAGPAALGLLAAIPALAGTAAGALGTVALAFDGVTSAITGDKKAYDALTPAQQQFVQEVRSLSGWLTQLKQTAAGDLFPGLDKALHETLTPGTVNAITTAVAEFAKAIGDAGEEWGHYFGSPEFQSIFGPLMAEGAHNVGTLADAALHLFDALGTLGRAGIPLTTWMTDAIDKGSRLVDEWTQAKSASGALAGGMNEAQQSLRLVVGLIGVLLTAAGALGKALLPVSQTAVKDLTDGLEALASTINRNEGEIRSIVGGALSALVTTVKAASQVIGELSPVIEKVADGLGGWKNVFEILIGFKVASVVNGWAAAFMKLGGAEGIGAAEASSSGLLANLTKLTGLGPIELTVDLALVGAGAVALDKLMGWAGTGISRATGGSPNNTPTTSKANDPSTWSKAELSAFAAEHGPETAAYYGNHPAAALRIANRVIGSNGGYYPGTQPTPSSGQVLDDKQLQALWVKAGGDPKMAPLMAQIALSESSGKANAYNKSGATGLWQILGQVVPGNLDNPLVNAKNAVAKLDSQGLGAWAASEGAWGKTAAYKAYLAGQSPDGSPSSPWGTPPPMTKNTGASAAATLASRLKADRSTLSGIEKQITADAKANLLPSDLVVELTKRAGSVSKAIADGTKSSLPAITKSLSGLKSEVQDGLTQATDDKKLQQTMAAIKDDLKNKLLSPDVAQGLLAKASKLDDELTSGLLSPETRKKVEANVSALKKQLSLDLDLQKERTDLKAEVSDLNAAIATGLFPPALEAIARKQAAAMGADIAEGTQAGSTAALAALTKLKATIAEGIADATAVNNFETTLSQFKGQLEDKLDQTLGIPETYATPAALAAAQEGAAKIVKAIEGGLSGPALKAAEASLSSFETTIESGLNGLEQAVELSKGSYENAWTRLAQAADTAFDQQTQSTVSKMQNDLQTALNNMQVMVSGSGFASFLYGGDITQTPSALAAQQLQQAHDDAAAQAQLAADQAAGDASAVAEDEYQMELTALQRKAALEQEAAEKQLDAAKQSYQNQQDAQIQAYQQQRTLVKQAMDDQVQDIETAFEQGNIDASTAFDQLTGLYQKNGVDIGGLSVVIAGQIYDGVSSWTSPIMQLMDDLLAKINEVKDAVGDTSSGGSSSASSPLPTAWAQSDAVTAIEAATGNVLSKGLVPQLAKGGIALPRPGGTLVNVAEAGRAEAILPLDALSNMASTASGPARDIVLEADGRELARASAEGLRGNRQAVRIVAQHVKPAMATVTSVGG